MAMNPVDSFLRGFAVVDQLESNRQNREFAREQQSRMRTLWERQDQEWEAAQLDKKRAEYLSQFDAEVQSITAEVGREADRRRKEGGEEAAAKYLDQWYSAGFERVANEALNRINIRDPEFGEHVSLALGRDISAGPLVKDPRRPVAGFQLIGPDKDPGGKGGLTFLVNSVNGSQPETERRSADPRDPVVINSLGMSELVRVFGQGVMNNDLHIAGVLREAVGFDSPQAATQTVRSEAQSTTTGGAGTTTGGAGTTTGGAGTTTGGAGTTTDGGAAAANDAAAKITANIDATDEELLAGRTSRPPDPNRFISDEEARAGRTPRPPGYATSAPSQGMVDYFGEDAANKLTALIEQETGWRGPPGVDDKNGVPDALLVPPIVKEGAKYAADRVKQLATPGERNTIPDALISEGVKVVGDKVREFAETPVRAAKRIRDIAVQTNNQVSSSTFKPDAVKTEEGAATASQSAPEPTSTAEVTDVAKSVAAAQGHKPNIIEVYNASRMAKLGVITAQELRQYAATGSFTPPAQAKFHSLGDGKWATTVNGVPIMFGDVPGGRTPKISDISAVRREVQSRVELQLKNNDGDVPHEQVAAFMNVYDQLATLHGYGEGDPRRIDGAFINNMIKGAELVQTFDEDDIQFWDNRWDTSGPFKDYEPPYSAASVAIAGTLYEQGVSGKDASYALRTYLQKMPSSYFDAQQVIATIRANERNIQRAYADMRENGEFTLPSGKKMAKPSGRFDLEDVRDAVVGDLVEMYLNEAQ